MNREHLYLEITGRCNLSCGHCSARQQIGQATEPGVDTILEALARFRAAGGKYLTLSGGEPGLRDDLADLVLGAGALEFRVTLVTNGLAVRAPVLSALSRIKGILAISVDGPTAPLHEVLRGPGTFIPVVKSLRRAVAELGGDRVMISTVLSSPLAREIAHLWDFVLREAVGALYVDLFEPTSQGVFHPLTPTDQEAAHAVLQLLDLVDGEESVRLAFSESDDLLKGRSVFSCRVSEVALGRTIKVQADGWAFPGPSYYHSRFRLGRPLEDGWFDTLSSPVLASLLQVARERTAKVSVCRDCFWSRRCGGGSLALSWAYYGTWDRACPLCRVYQASLDRAALKEMLHAPAVGA